MRSNLEAAGDLLMAESVSVRLAGTLGRGRAHDLAAAAAREAVRTGVSLKAELTGDDEVAAAMTGAQLDEALRPEAYLGATDCLIDRALAAHGDRPGQPEDGPDAGPNAGRGSAK